VANQGVVELRPPKEKSPLAIRADSKKFQPVGHGFEAVCSGDARFDFARKTFVNFNHFRAARADQMMVMPVIAFADEFESRRAVAKVKPFHHAHFLKQVHCAVNGRQIALAFGYGGENFPVRQRMGVSAQNFQDRLARTGNFVRLPAQTTRQCGQFLPLVRMGTGADFHYPSKITPAIPKNKFKCKSLATHSRKKSRPTANAAEWRIQSLHQQHLARALDGAGQLALIMRGHPRVFARQDAALICHILPEQIGVFEIERVNGEVNLRFRPRRAIFRLVTRPTAVPFVCIGFAWHGYLISR
jgi:hypothetical protein